LFILFTLKIVYDILKIIFANIGLVEYDDSLNKDVDEKLPLYWNSFTGNVQKNWYALELYFKKLNL
jgi:hypothetical protein